MPRRADLRAWLERLAPNFNCTVQVREVDIARSSEDDLSGEGLWEQFFSEVADGFWDSVQYFQPGTAFVETITRPSTNQISTISIWVSLGLQRQQADVEATQFLHPPVQEDGHHCLQGRKILHLGASRMIARAAFGSGLNCVHCCAKQGPSLGPFISVTLEVDHLSPPACWETLAKKWIQQVGLHLTARVTMKDHWQPVAVTSSMF